jgi:lipoprotein NlpD
MTSIISKLVFSILFSAVLNGCTSVQPNHAPVSPAPQPPSPPPPSNIIKEESNFKEETKYHLVQKGETLYSISRNYGFDYRQVAQWNQIVPPYKIELGRKIKVSDPISGFKPQNGGEHIQAVIKPQVPKEPTLTPITRTSPQKNTTIPLYYVPTLIDRPPYKAQPLKKPLEKSPAIQEKKSIISIDNEFMLKLNFKWPIKGKILKSFSKTDNKGIDIAGELGQDVGATEAGKVVYSGQGLIGYGQLLIIKHNDMFLSAYANLSRLLVAEGYTVEKGQVIAKVGQAGSNKTALHFEIRKNGKPVNPLNFLPGNQ